MVTRCNEVSFPSAKLQTGSGVAGIALGAGSLRKVKSMVMSSKPAARIVFQARMPMRQSMRPTKPMYPMRAQCFQRHIRFAAAAVKVSD